MLRLLRENIEIILDVNGVLIHEFDEIPVDYLNKIIFIDLTLHYQQLKQDNLLEQWKNNALKIIEKKGGASLLIGTILSPIVIKWWRESLLFYEKEIFAKTQYKIELIRDVNLLFNEEEETALRSLELEFVYMIRNVRITDYSLPFQNNQQVMCPAGNSYFRVWNDGTIEGCPYTESLKNMGNVKKRKITVNDSYFRCSHPGHYDCDCVRIKEYGKMILLDENTDKLEQ